MNVESGSGRCGQNRGGRKEKAEVGEPLPLATHLGSVRHVGPSVACVRVERGRAEGEEALEPEAGQDMEGGLLDCAAPWQLPAGSPSAIPTMHVQSPLTGPLKVLDAAWLEAGQGWWVQSPPATWLCPFPRGQQSERCWVSTQWPSASRNCLGC